MTSSKDKAVKLKDAYVSGILDAANTEAAAESNAIGSQELAGDLVNASELGGVLGAEIDKTAQVYGGGYGYNNSGSNSYGYNQYHSSPRNSTPLPSRSRYQDPGYGGSSRGGYGFSMDRSYGGGW